VPEYPGTARNHTEKRYANKVPNSGCNCMEAKKRKEKDYKRFMEGKTTKRRTRQASGNPSQL